jgi:hypothetical protein
MRNRPTLRTTPQISTTRRAMIPRIGDLFAGGVPYAPAVGTNPC